MQKLKLSPPWIELYNEFEVLFAGDPNVTVEYHDEDCEIKLYVEGDKKADALMKLLPPYRTFGNTTVTITVIPANGEDVGKSDLIQDAFEGNSAFDFITTGSNPMTAFMSYVVFHNEVVQYHNDNLGDIYGNRSTLYQEIAKDIFGTIPGVYFCTNVPEKDPGNG